MDRRLPSDDNVVMRWARNAGRPVWAGWDAFAEHVQSASARLPVATRRQIFAQSRSEQSRPERAGESELERFCALVAERSYRVSAADIAALKRAGHSEDEIFEAIVVAAAGAAQRRLDAVRAAAGG